MGSVVKRGRLSSTTHALIGAGHMGGALLSGWLSGRGAGKMSPQEILVIDPSPGEAATKALELGAKVFTAAHERFCQRAESLLASHQAANVRRGRPAIS